MLDQIVNLVKEQAMSQFINNTEVPNERAEEAAEIAGQSIFEGLKEEVLSGNITKLTGLLSGKVDTEESGIAEIIKSGLAHQLTSKMGLDAQTTSDAASSVLPGLLEQVIGKFASPKQEDAGFDVASLIQMASGGEGGVEDMVKGMIGKKLGDTFGGLFGR